MIKFYLFVVFEYFLHLLHIKRAGRIETQRKERNPILNNEVIYHTHEWAGYPFERYKIIKYTGNKFVCGLRFFFDKFNSYKGTNSIRGILTVSDFNEQYEAKLKKQGFYNDKVEIYAVPNSGMDFSGYSFVAKNIIDSTNRYIFLTNSSVNGESDNFIDDYIRVFNKNPNLGLLGISYSSKIYQTLIRSNYTPHVQSFFLLTTTDILGEILRANGGDFPGEKESFKLSIIRFGEAKLSQIVSLLGYDIGIINESGLLQILPPIKDSSLVDGDYRLFVKKPNFVNKIAHE